MASVRLQPLSPFNVKQPADLTSSVWRPISRAKATEKQVGTLFYLKEQPKPEVKGRFREMETARQGVP